MSVGASAGLCRTRAKVTDGDAGGTWYHRADESPFKEITTNRILKDAIFERSRSGILTTRRMCQYLET